MSALVTICSDLLEATLLPHGAALVGLRFAGQRRNHVLGFADPDDHSRVPIYAGAIVGPVANRLAGGQVQIDGTSYQMPLNENGTTTLHAGPKGLHAQTWQIVDQGAAQVRLACTLPHGACGLPGTRTISATYALKGGVLTLTLEAETDQPTPMNLAAHPYWNLDGRGDIASHSLHLQAQTYLPVTAANLPTGQIAPVAGGLFDFTRPRAVPRDPKLDVNYCLAPASRDTPQPAAVLRGADGTSLHIATTAPGLQVYNGAFLPKGAPPLQDGPPLAPYAALALEPQHWPDAPHHAGFPDILLMPKSRYRQITCYDLRPG